jgi:hypothetical protein
MGHVCRVCEKTLLCGEQCIDFSTVVADIADLHTSCASIEEDLHDSFNAFCFKCRRITMSVPAGVTVNEQVCYLRSQVVCLEQLRSYDLIIKRIPDIIVEPMS